MNGAMTEVLPPATAPVDQAADTLGLCPGLHAQREDDQYRCACCSEMQPPASWIVWVPDSARKGDPEWSVTEESRQNAYNGHHSGWCLTCAKQFKKTGATSTAIPAPGASKRWWQFWL